MADHVLVCGIVNSVGEGFPIYNYNFIMSIIIIFLSMDVICWFADQFC